MKAITLAPLFAALLLSACKNTEGDPANTEAANKEAANKEAANKEAANTEAAGKDAANKPASQPASQPAAQAAWGQDSLGKYQVFGAGLAGTPPEIVEADDLAQNVKSYEGKTVRVTGMVTGTCAKKGCWMNVAGSDGSGRVFVRFLDYKFFVPKAGAEGRKVVFEGVVADKEFSIEETKHYLEDAGDYEAAKKVTAPSRVPFVMATGVQMYASKK